MKVLKTVVSGAGRIGWKVHIPEVHAHDGFMLTAVSDPVTDRLAEVKERYGVNTYTDYYEMIDTEKPDLVVIGSPTNFHMEQAICAMEKGIDVFLDKPMAVDLKQAEKIYEVYKSTGRKLMMYQPLRAEARMQCLLKIIKSNVIGDIFLIKSGSNTYVIRDDWQAFEKYGGGMLNNYGAHQIDSVLYMVDSPIKKINASMFNITSAGDADDVVKILMHTESNIAVDIEINMAAAINTPGSVVYGKYGTIIYNQTEIDDGYYTVRYFDPEEYIKHEANESLAAKNRRYITTQPEKWYEEKHPVDDSSKINYYDECYKYFALDEKPFVPVTETMEVMRIIDKCRKDAQWNT